MNDFKNNLESYALLIRLHGYYDNSGQYISQKAKFGFNMDAGLSTLNNQQSFVKKDYENCFSQD